MKVDNILNRIRAYRKESGLTISGYGRRAGVAEATIRNMDEPDWSPNVRTVRLLEAVIPDDFQPLAADGPLVQQGDCDAR